MALSAFANTVILLMTGCFLMVIGGGLIAVFKRVIHNVISQQVVLTNGSVSFEAWLDPPVPILLQFYLFDVMNKDEIVKGEKPVLRQIGPYAYREVRTKQELIFHKNDTLSYKEPKTYVFDPDKSTGSEDDTITSVNLLFVTVVDALDRLAPGWIKKLGGEYVVDKLLGLLGNHVFTKQKVGDVIWGKPNLVLELIHDILKTFHIDVAIPEEVGLFAGQNGTDDGLYTVYTGTGGKLDNLNIINKWNGESSLPYWNGTLCNMINGTDGTLYHPFVDKSETLYLFSTDICRSIYVTYDSDQTNYGIQLYRFVPPLEVFANHTENPVNKGYCRPDCLGAGVLDITPCKGAPVIISQPHFYQAAPYYINAIQGMHPNKEEHETFVDVEPNTGAVMNAAKRLQINIHLKNISDVTELAKIPPTIFPVAWVNETAKIDEATADKFTHEVMLPILATTIVQYALMALGFLLILVGIVYASKKRVCHRKQAGYQSINGEVKEEDSVSPVNT
ncbi:lysosome membrane protein 2-like isoform X2 [Lineus longissimus]|uniref:lysosome membrane protein 2-like isoform X2 n=1 Tax=Lineus longissimus TaxID=88925 RepID=UPI002B4E7D2A